MVVTYTTRAKIEIGNSNGFSGVKIGCFQNITIGDNCLFGANVLITDSDWHPIDPAKRQDLGDDYAATNKKPVKIGNNVFIGVNTIILKGTTIGDNSVIGAGSVVSGNIPANVIAAGNPCKVIKSL
ncbi:DapH/DapD/GlmU-related protein [Candidatus Symbiothrix dinenymphae]|uniref:DapH/DapD/GlmU-related protein n=1 Tax=Candidatus Symbiothrix dinenymphae TaxID=467085 RepID=UPI001D03FB9A|nr:DapH/DapD/GlmU-related protein [Candidatus Symbiothrix dinenymphae]